MPNKENWVVCPTPEIEDIIRWNEPIWAAPNKPRGKPDKIGEQRITGLVLKTGEFFELEVMAVEKLTPRAAKMNVTVGDKIRRKPTSIALGACHKRAK